jgi:hypothetical protein
LNNPPVGLVTPDTDPDLEQQTYAYDPHLDPQLQWAGKAEHTSFQVPTVSLHVHEGIDPLTIIEAVRRAPAHSLRLADSLLQSPVLTIPDAQRILGVSQSHSARRTVEKLVAAGILRQAGATSYGRTYLAEDILHAVGEGSA